VDDRAGLEIEAAVVRGALPGHDDDVAVGLCIRVDHPHLQLVTSSYRGVADGNRPGSQGVSGPTDPDCRRTHQGAIVPQLDPDVPGVTRATAGRPNHERDLDILGR